MAEHDHALRPRRRHDVVRVVEPLPFALFAGEDQVGVGEHSHQRRQLTVAGHEPDFRDLRRRLADSAQRLDPEPILREPGRGFERRLGNGDDSVRWLKVMLPAHGAKESLRHRLRPPHVPVVVEPPDDEIVFLDQLGLALVDRIGLDLGRAVRVAVEGRLVADDEVSARRGRALEHRHRRHDGRGDAAHGRVGIAGLERVDGFSAPRDAEVGLNAFDDAARREGGLAGPTARRQRGRCPHWRPRTRVWSCLVA